MISYKSFCVENPQPMQRKDFFKNYIGMDESFFRTTFRWTIPTQPIGMEEAKHYFLNTLKYPRALGMFAGFYQTKTIEDLRSETQNKKFQGEPKFSIIIHDPVNQNQTDIRFWQAMYPNAAFQIASNFNTLEGGMGKPETYLTNMLKSPTQGEEASICTPATVYRKYAHQPINLLEKLYPKIEMTTFNYYASIDNKIKKEFAQKKKTLSPQEKQKIGVGIHSNIVVGSGVIPGGPNGTGYDGYQSALPYTIDRVNNEITSGIKITQIFTAAVDLRNTRAWMKKNNRKQVPPGLAQLCQDILDADYLGTVLGALYDNKQQVVLTFMGGGSFRNEISWIIAAIEKVKNIIKNKNMHVVIFFRTDKSRQYFKGKKISPDKDKYGDVTNPVRNFATDAPALKRLIAIADEINNTNRSQSEKKNLDLNVDKYIQLAYQLAEKKAANVNTGDLPQQVSQAAQAIQNQLLTILPETKSSKKPKPTPPSVKPAKTNIKDYSMYQELKKYINVDPKTIKETKKAQELIDAIDYLRNLIRNKIIITFDASEWNKISNMRKSLVNRKNQLLKPAPKGATKDPLIDALQRLGTQLNVLKNNL